MGSLERQPIPQTAMVEDPVELELIAIHEITSHPELFHLQLLCMGGMAVASSVEAALQEED